MELQFVIDPALAAWWHAAAVGTAVLKWLGIVLFIVAAAALNRSLRR